MAARRKSSEKTYRHPIVLPLVHCVAQKRAVLFELRELLLSKTGKTGSTELLPVGLGNDIEGVNQLLVQLSAREIVAARRSRLCRVVLEGTIFRIVPRACKQR